MSLHQELRLLEVRAGAPTMNGYRGAEAGWPFFVLHKTLVSVIAIESGSRASCPALARNSWRGGPSEWSLTGSRQTSHSLGSPPSPSTATVPLFAIAYLRSQSGTLGRPGSSSDSFAKPSEALISPVLTRPILRSIQPTSVSDPL